MYKVGVFLARFQPLHKSHEYLIRQSLSQNEKTCVFVGSADKSRTIRNPLTYEERIVYINAVFADEIASGKLIVEPLSDFTDENDKDNLIKWGNYLYKSIVNKIQEYTFDLYYSDDPEIIYSWFSDEIKRKIHFVLYDRKQIFSELSATKIREAILNDNHEYLKSCLSEQVYKDRIYIKGILQNIH